MPKPVLHPSPNFDARDKSVPLRFVVIHYTGMKVGADALHRLCDPASKVSAHYLIEEDGNVFQMLDETLRAWHAGKAFWQGITDLNSASIGIELANPGHQFGYGPFPIPQIKSLSELLLGISRRNQMNLASFLLAHAEIAPTRKQDPGELFPWRDLAKAGFGIWPEVQSTDYGFADDGEVQVLLRGLGYECPDSGSYDQPTRAALIAFQRRYHPENLTGTPERETIARMRALKRAVSKEEVSSLPRSLPLTG